MMVVVMMTNMLGNIWSYEQLHRDIGVYDSVPSAYQCYGYNNTYHHSVDDSI